MFRSKFVAGLKSAFRTGTLQFTTRRTGDLYLLLRLLFRHDWLVYAKRPFGRPEHALRYLSA
jgi:hypothetical protein